MIVQPWMLRRATFRFTLDEWHRGAAVAVGHPHWDGYEPVSVSAEDEAGEFVDVTVWFRRLAGVGVARPAEPPQESLATGPDVIAAIDEEIAQAASVWESNPTLTALRDARATIVALTKEVTGLREQLAGGASVGDTKL